MGLLSDIKIDGSVIKETFNGIGGLFNTIREVLTGEASPEKKLAAMQKLDEMEQQLKISQIEVNKIEATHGSWWVAGWRPAIGWVCAAALLTYYVPQTLMATILWSIQCTMVMLTAADITKISLPSYPNTFDVQEILGLVTSMLGVAWLRSQDKKIK